MSGAELDVVETSSPPLNHSITITFSLSRLIKDSNCSEGQIGTRPSPHYKHAGSCTLVHRATALLRCRFLSRLVLYPGCRFKDARSSTGAGTG